MHNQIYGNVLTENDLFCWNTVYMQIRIALETKIRDHVRQLEDMFAQGQF